MAFPCRVTRTTPSCHVAHGAARLPRLSGHPGLSGSTKALSCAHLLVKLRTSCLWCFYYATPKVSLASDRNLRGTAGTGTLLRCRTTVVREPEAPETINGRNPTN